MPGLNSPSVGVNRILRGFLSLSAGEITARALGFLSSLYLARVLGIERFGQIGFVFAVYGYFALLASPGLETVGTREVARNPIRASSLAATLFSLRVVFSVAAYVLLLLFAFLFSPDVNTRTLFWLQGLTLLLTSLSVQFLFRGINKMHVVAIAQVLQATGYLALLFLLVRDAGHLFFIPLCFFSSTFLSSIYLVWKSLAESGSWSYRFSLEGTGPILKSAAFLGLSSFMVLIYYSLDSVMLGFMKGVNAVGLYTAAYKIVLLITALPGLILSAFFPSLSTGEGAREQQLSLNQYLTVMILLGLPVGCLGYFLSPLLLEICYGKSYLEAAVPLQILLFNATVVFLSMAFANPLTAMGRNREYLKVVSSGAAVNIIMNVLLIPSFGLIGAAVATLISELVVAIQAKRELSKVSSFRIIDVLGYPLLFAVVAFGASVALSLVLPNVPLLAALVCTALYVGLIVGSRRRVLRSFLSV